MKKVLSLILALAMLFTMAPVAMAEETGEEIAVSLAEKYAQEVGNRWTWKDAGDNKLAYKAWYVASASDAPTQKENTASTKLTTGLGVVLKFPMPVIPEGKVLDKYVLQLTGLDIHSTGIEVLKLPGENLDVASFRINTAPYSTAVSNISGNSAIERDADGNKVAIPYEATSVSTAYRSFVEITSYVQELYDAGQRDHFYVIYGATSSQRNIVVNTTWGSYTPADIDQTSFHSFKDPDPIEVTETTPAQGAEILPYDEVSMTFNNALDSAIATLNGEEVLCTVSGNKVTLDAELKESTAYELELSIMDMFGSAKTFTLSFTTKAIPLTEKYLNEVGNRWTWKMEGDNKLAYKAWLVNSPTAAPTQKDNTQSTKLTGKHVTILKFPMPKPEAGQKIGKYILQLSASGTSGSALDILKLPGENYDVSTFTTASEPLSTILANVSAYSAVEKDENGNKVAIPTEATSISDVSRNFFDITTYVNDLYNAGQRDHFYVIYGCINSQKNIVVNTTWSEYTPADVDQTSFHSFAPADPLAVAETVPLEGAVVPASTVVSVRFNNGVASAKATLNGEEAECAVSGATVTLNETLSQYEDYTLVVEAKDVYGTTLEYTLKFSTIGTEKTAKLKDGVAYYITASADPAEVTVKQNIDKRASHMMVFRLPVPEIPEGKILDKFIFNGVAFSQAACSAYKLPGDDWELTEDKNGDGQLLRFADLVDYATAANVVSSKITNTDLDPNATGNKHFAQTFDMTTYVNECIARGESYIDFIMIAGGSTMDYFGFKTANWDVKYAASYEYSLAVPEIKVVDAKVNAYATGINELSFQLLSDFTDDVASKAIVRKEDTNEVVEATFAYNAASRTVYIESCGALEKGTAYEVVLQPLSDKYGNIADSEIIVTTFETKAVVLAFDDVEIVAQDQGYKAVSKITNHSGKKVGYKFYVAQYDGNKLVAVKSYSVYVDDGAENLDVATLNFEIAEGVTTVKAFLLSDVKPLAGYAESAVGE